MSFVRVGRSQQQHSKGKRPVHPKKAAAFKREWVSTVNDLSVHKLTPAEVNHRHEIHKSHNKAAAQWELREKALQRRLRHPGSPAPLDPTSLSIIREVFSDQLLLQDVLARSDRAMAVVKDLFGDAPRRQTGHPSVTMAPNCDSDSALPLLQRPDPPTQLSLLSQSMMDQQALNEVEESPEEDYSDGDAYPADYHVIKRANVRKMKEHSRGRGARQQKAHRPNSGEGDNDPVSPCTSRRAPDRTALNATGKVRRVRSRRSPSVERNEEPLVSETRVLNPEIPLNHSGRICGRTRGTRKCVSQSSELDGPSFTSLNGDQSSLGMLQAMLGQVEQDLDTLSSDAEPASAGSWTAPRKQTLTGFSVALVSTIGRLVNLLKQSEEESRRAAEERARLEETLREQRGLIDALTAESMALRQEAAVQQAGLQRRTEELEHKLETVVLVLGGFSLLDTCTDPPQDSDVQPTGHQSAPAAPAAEPPPAPVHSALLLSPPRQRDNWQQTSASHPVPPPYRNPPPRVVASPLSEDVQRSHSASSASSAASVRFTGLNSSTTSTTPTPSSSSPSSLGLAPSPQALAASQHISPEAMLAEIAQLSRQNELLKARLDGQPRSLGSVSGSVSGSGSVSVPGSVSGSVVGGGASPSSTDGRRNLRSNSSGQLTPQSFAERTGSVSSSTERKSWHGTIAEGEQRTNQAPMAPRSFSVCGVEQRLLELNRQSAAARGRLLELIDQQKQQQSVSPPGQSPAPRSALSPHSAGQSPELVDEQDVLSQAGSGERRAAGSVESSHSLGRESRVGKSQMEKQREQEGWFSLSAHMR